MARYKPVDPAVSALSITDRPIWKCATCKSERLPTVHQLRKTYCSKVCMSIAYRQTMLGAANPNHKNAGWRDCKQCGKAFQSYQPNRMYCGKVCFVAWQNRDAKPKPQWVQLSLTLYPKRIRKGRAKSGPVNCFQCGKSFSAARSSKRKYCSYPCFIASGGATRAGEAAVRAVMKYGAKKDANHHEVMDVIKARWPVLDLSHVGFGCPDGIAEINKTLALFDIKNPKTAYGKKGLNTRQKRWADEWRGGPVYLLYSVEDAVKFCNGQFDELKQHASGGQAVETPAAALRVVTGIGEVDPQ